MLNSECQAGTDAWICTKVYCTSVRPTCTKPNVSCRFWSIHKTKKMERNNEDLFVFKSTGRKFSTHGMDCISITVDEQIRYGYDGYVELMDDEGDDDSELEFSIEEKKELAVYMIDKWSKFGGVSNGS